MKKRGLSTVVSVLLIVLLTVVAAGMVFAIVSTLVGDTQRQAESCGPELLGQLTINPSYTCFLDVGDTKTNAFFLSINQGDVELEGISVVMTAGSVSNTESFPTTTSGDICEYDPSYKDPPGYECSGTASLPGPNSGNTYIIQYKSLPENGVSPDSVRIYPVVDGETCELADSISEIPPCSRINNFPN